MILSDLLDLKKVVPTVDEFPTTDLRDGFQVIGTLNPDGGAVYVLGIRAMVRQKALEAKRHEYCQTEIIAKGKLTPETETKLGDLTLEINIARAEVGTYQVLLQQAVIDQFREKVVYRAVQVCTNWQVAVGEPYASFEAMLVEEPLDPPPIFYQKRGEA